jgi:hypothetical protein
MKRTFLALSCLALLLVIALIVGAGLGLAQTSGPVPDARPTPTPILPLPERQSPNVPESPDIPPLPDLIVEKIEVVPATPKIGQTVKIMVTIKNQSSHDVDPGNNFWSDVYVDPAVVPIRLGQDGVYDWGCQATWVPAGGSHILETSYVFDDVKSYSLYAQVDTDGHVLEANETNNVLGPIVVQVQAIDKIVHQTHEQFQEGMASTLDVSHPQGVIRPGIFVEPDVEPNVYTPDYAINDPTAVETDTGLSQVKPALASNGTGTLYVVWEDGRWGGLFNRRIYFRRSTPPNSGQTWIGETLVDQDPAVNPATVTFNQVSPDLVYDSDAGRLYAVWQDGRDGDYDIYFAYSTNQGATWQPQPARKLNDDVGSANQLNPSIALGPGGEVYVVWQDQRNGNDDVYLVRSDNSGVSWGPNYFVTDDPDMAAQNQVAPSVAVEEEFGIVYVGWEDWRNPQHPEIYVMWSWDEGRTFGIDVPVVYPPAGSYRTAPSLKAQTTAEIVEVEDPVTGELHPVERPVSVVHVAWQEGTNDGADVYYSYAPYVHYDPDVCPWPYDFCFTPRQEVSGFVIDSEYVRRPEDTSYWPIEPSWQGQVSLDFVPPDMYFTQCHADSTKVYSKGVMIAWSDARSYDDWRYEIRTRRVASPEGDPKRYEVCEDWAVGMVNGNPKIYALRDDPAKYEIYKPAATGQADPSILVDEAGIYVAWDDERWDDPSLTGKVRNRDVFSSRMRLPGETKDGIYISPVLDGQDVAPRWYVLSWFGATQHSGDLLFQTRFGNNRNPPKGDVAADTWTRWTGNPGSPGAVGCSAGIACYYDAPGRHIVRPDGTDWFSNPSGAQYRYMQYKVIITGPDRLTALSQVTVYYDGGGFNVYLPVVLRRR